MKNDEQLLRGNRAVFKTACNTMQKSGKAEKEFYNRVRIFNGKEYPRARRLRLVREQVPELGAFFYFKKDRIASS